MQLIRNSSSFINPGGSSVSFVPLPESINTAEDEEEEEVRWMVGWLVAQGAAGEVALVASGADKNLWSLLVLSRISERGG